MVKVSEIFIQVSDVYIKFLKREVFVLFYYTSMVCIIIAVSIRFLNFVFHYDVDVSNSVLHWLCER